MDDDFDSRWERDIEREPGYRNTRRPTPLVATGTVKAAMGHGPQCSCQWCSEQPLTDAALCVLRKGGLL